MRKIICDRCGAEITGDRIGYVAAGWKAPSDKSFIQNNPYERMDFCEGCMKEIIALIDKKKSRRMKVAALKQRLSLKKKRILSLSGRRKRRGAALKQCRILNLRRDTKASTCGGFGNW